MCFCVLDEKITRSRSCGLDTHQDEEGRLWFNTRARKQSHTHTNVQPGTFGCIHTFYAAITVLLSVNTFKFRHWGCTFGIAQALFWSCLFTRSVFSRPCGFDCVIWNKDKDGGELREEGEQNSGRRECRRDGCAQCDSDK